MSRFNKITTGFVIQTYDTQEDKLVCVEQQFIAGDQVDYEDLDGNPIKVDTTKEIYQPFEMVQPVKPHKFVLVENSSGGECGEPFEADNAEEALREVLEGMGYRLRRV